MVQTSPYHHIITQMYSISPPEEEAELRTIKRSYATGLVMSLGCQLQAMDMKPNINCLLI